MKITFLLLITFFIQTACKAQVNVNQKEQAKLLYSWDFEGADSLHNLGIEDESPLKNGLSIVSDPTNPLNRVLRTVLLKGNDRTEVSLFTNNLKKIIYFYADASKGFIDKNNITADNTSLGNEVWMSIKILKPQEQNTNGIKPCMVQLGVVSNAALNPPVSSSGFCQLRMRNGSTPTSDSWNWRVFGGNIYTPSPLNVDKSFVSPTYGKWEKFVLHCKYSTGNNGLIEVWKDSKKYINMPGQNAFAFNRFRIKWGIYLGIGNSAGQDLTCYFDDVKIAGSNSSFEEISK